MNPDEDMVATETFAVWQLLKNVAPILKSRQHVCVRLPFHVFRVPQHPGNDRVDDESVGQEDFLDSIRSGIAM